MTATLLVAAFLLAAAAAVARATWRASVCPCCGWHRGSPAWKRIHHRDRRGR